MPFDTKIQSGTAKSLRETIISMAQQKSLSYDAISKRCSEQGEDVSKSTIAAFFNNPDLDLGYKKLMAISRAVSGYDISIRQFSEPLPMDNEDKAEYMRDLMEAKKDRILDLEAQLRRISDERDSLRDKLSDMVQSNKSELSTANANHRAEIAELRLDHKEEIKELHEEAERKYAYVSRDKRIWRAMALFMLIALTVFTIIDMLDTNSGWIQSSGIDGIFNPAFISSALFNLII